MRYMKTVFSKARNGFRECEISLFSLPPELTCSVAAAEFRMSKVGLKALKDTSAATEMAE